MDEAEDPTKWAKVDFRKWKSDSYPLSTDALNVTQSGNNANAGNATLNTTNTTVPASKTKLEKDAWLSRR